MLSAVVTDANKRKLSFIQQVGFTSHVRFKQGSCTYSQICSQSWSASYSGPVLKDSRVFARRRHPWFCGWREHCRTRSVYSQRFPYLPAFANSLISASLRVRWLVQSSPRKLRWGTFAFICIMFADAASLRRSRSSESWHQSFPRWSTPWLDQSKAELKEPLPSLFPPSGLHALISTWTHRQRSNSLSQ